MTNEEIQKAMEFVLEMDSRTVITLDRLSKKVNAVPVAKKRSEKKWKRTEARLQALLSHARKRNRGTSALPRLPGPRHVTAKPLPLRKADTDERLKALAELVERQISERRNRNS
jgi:hypothetical protein